MLIICEGEVTEPEYFAQLRRMAIDGGIWAEIVIKPKPRSENTVSPHTRSPHKSARIKRKLIKVAVPNEVDSIEKKYDVKSQPISWIKEARDNLKDEAFEEVWAVFDHDGRNKTENAFQLAREKVNGKVVNIAFSSIAFEHWILLHFERNANAFKKSLCRTGDQIHECGSSISTDDCGGAHCLIGYMRHNLYLSSDSTTKRHDTFSELLGHLTEDNNRQIAYANAAWLRHIVPHDPLKPYGINPFTNVDTLVQRLLGEEQEIAWGIFDQPILWHEIAISASISNNTLVINFNNLSKSSRLIRDSDISVFISTALNQFTPLTQSIIIRPHEQKEITESIAESKEVSVKILCKGAKLFIA